MGGPTFFEKEIGHVAPRISERVRNTLIEACRAEGVEHRDGGVYVQARGPRFETPAEIRFFASVGDVVGMTFASEATLASEKGIEIGALCTVDNYANGVSREKVTYETVKKRATENTKKVERIIGRVLGL